MKKSIIIIAAVSAVFLLNTCALEIANVLGPDGGYVFYDKGSYTYGWRYIQCSPYDFGEIKDLSEESIKKALELCNENSAEWHKFGWELPTEEHLRKMLECFSYGLTRFSDGYFYLAVNNLYDTGRWWICQNNAGCGLNGEGVRNSGNFCTNCSEPAPHESVWVTDKDAPPNTELLKESSVWDGIIFHKNFSEKSNGAVEQVADSGGNPIKIRAIRRF